jgi:uroporphyrinogen-III synthase
LLLITRPAAEADRTAREAAHAGFDVLLAPLLEIEPLSFTLPRPLPEVLLFTSAQGCGPAAAAYPELLAVPAWAVGARTGEAAAAAGFRVVGTGIGDGSEALALVREAGAKSVLHLTGADKAPVRVPDGLEVETRAVYRARAAERLPHEATTALAEGRVFATLLFSARSAQIFADLLDREQIGRTPLRLVGLSEAVARAAGPGWGAIGIAAAPTLGAAFAAARALWQGRDDG